MVGSTCVPGSLDHERSILLVALESRGLSLKPALLTPRTRICCIFCSRIMESKVFTKVYSFSEWSGRRNRAACRRACSGRHVKKGVTCASRLHSADETPASSTPQLLGHWTEALMPALCYRGAIPWPSHGPAGASCRAHARTLTSHPHQR